MNKVRLKQLNKQIGWTYGESPKDGNEYWVATDQGTVFTAIASASAHKGWCNHDTWEDFDNAVIAYIKIPKPLFKV